MLTLRRYQEEAINAVIQRAGAGIRRQLLHLPTGAGKTVIAAALSRKASGRVLMLVDRDELVQQSVEKFGYVWPDEEVGVVKAERDETDRKVVVASVQTLARPQRLARLDSESFTLVIADEAHHATTARHQRVLEGFGMLPDPAPRRLLLGITATPNRSDGHGLGEVFQEVVYHKSIVSLIQEGYLSDVKGVRVETHLDLGRVRITEGDFDTKDLSLAVDTEARNRLIVEAYQRFGEGKKAVVFTVDVAHAMHIAEAFSKVGGIRADWVSGELPLPERRKRLATFHAGGTQVIANAQILTEGWDEPSVACVIMARPTRSATFFIQAVGRGLRLYPGKDYCVVVDVADNRQDLCSLAVLEGITERQKRHRNIEHQAGEGDAESAPLVADWPSGPDHDDELAGAKLIATPLDLLARSLFRWHAETKNKIRLEAGPGQDIYLVRVAPELWNVELRGKGVIRDLSERPLPLEYAQGIAEEFVRQSGHGWFANRNAPWRTKGMSQRQFDLLRSLGVEPHEGMTREEAQDLIRKTLRDRSLSDPDAPWRSEPASEKQLAWMKAHGFRIHSGITKGDIADLMERLKRRWGA